MVMPMQPQVPMAPQVMAPPMVPPRLPPKPPATAPKHGSLRGHVSKKLAGKKAKK